MGSIELKGGESNRDAIITHWPIPPALPHGRASADGTVVQVRCKTSDPAPLIEDSQPELVTAKRARSTFRATSAAAQ